MVVVLKLRYRHFHCAAFDSSACLHHNFVPAYAWKASQMKVSSQHPVVLTSVVLTSDLVSRVFVLRWALQQHSSYSFYANLCSCFHYSFETSATDSKNDEISSHFSRSEQQVSHVLCMRYYSYRHARLLFCMFARERRIQVPHSDSKLETIEDWASSRPKIFWIIEDVTSPHHQDREASLHLWIVVATFVPVFECDDIIGWYNWYCHDNTRVWFDLNILREYYSRTPRSNTTYRSPHDWNSNTLRNKIRWIVSIRWKNHLSIVDISVEVPPPPPPQSPSHPMLLKSPFLLAFFIEKSFWMCTGWKLFLSSLSLSLWIWFDFDYLSLYMTL